MPSADPPLIAIVGPTAVGKTAAAIDLAKRLNGEIVSADSRLFYRGMDIGTAKPTAAEQARIPHHLIDIADPDQTFSLAEFQQAAAAVIADIHARGRLPLLVGGTGQYVHAVIRGWSPPAVAPDPRLRAVLEGLGHERGIHWLHEGLAAIDPQAAARIDARNLRRTVRALEVILTSGRRFSDQRGRLTPPYRILTLGLQRPRPDLYARIDARVAQMFADGLLEEVRGLLERGYDPDLPCMSAIGYRECMRVLRGECTLEQAQADIRRATRVYVRRQANWFKQDDPEIRWFAAGDAEAIAAMESAVRTWLRSGSTDPADHR